MGCECFRTDSFRKFRKRLQKTNCNTIVVARAGLARIPQKVWEYASRQNNLSNNAPLLRKSFEAHTPERRRGMVDNRMFSLTLDLATVEAARR